MARRSALVVPLMVLALGYAITVTTSAMLSRTSPDLAIWLDSKNSLALASAATLAAAEISPSGARRAETLSRQALAASPISSEAAAALGTARTLLDPRTDVQSIFRYSRFLGRRTALTEIWYIEHSAGTGDIVEALRAYDHLFRVSDYYRTQFLPVLLSASAQPEVARAMVPILARQPAWRDEYFRGLVETFPGAGNFAMLVHVLGFDPRNPDGAKRLSLAMNRLVQADRPDLAYGVYRDAMGAQGDMALVRNGEFRGVDTLVPFDWDLTESDELLAQIGTNDAGYPALLLSNRAGRAGPLARQLLLLRPGGYRLTFAVGNVTGATSDRPQMRVACVSGAPILSSTIFPEALAVGRNVAADFRVPVQGCAAQWLIIQAGNPVDAIVTQQWVSRIRIASVPVSTTDRKAKVPSNPAGAGRWD